MKTHRVVEPLFPDELIIEILSWVPVKPLLRFRCVCRSWKSLISHPHFVKLHRQRSQKIPNLIVIVSSLLPRFEKDTCVFPCSKRSFLNDPSSTIVAATRQRDCYRLKNKYWVVGSCNGLVCLHGQADGVNHEFGESWVRFWNPATRLRSNKSPRLRVNFVINSFVSTKFGFGYDKSSDAYKVVAVISRSDKEGPKRTHVKVYTLGDNCWRDIQSFPAFTVLFHNEARFLSGTLNWLARRKWDIIAIDQLEIVSLHVGKETYKQLLLPDGLDEVSKVQPILGVLMECLCLSHDYKTTHFVVWQMKEFGVEKSWTRLLNVSYQHLQIERSLQPWLERFPLLPLCISENCDVWMLMDVGRNETIRYNQRDNRAEYAYIPKAKIWIDVKDHVQSLVLPC